MAATELGRAFYRPYIRANGINDFHIADTVGSSFGTIATIFLAIAILGGDEQRDRQFLIVGAASICAYELAQPLFGASIDPWDVLASVVAGVLSAFIYRAVH